MRPFFRRLPAIQGAPHVGGQLSLTGLRRGDRALWLRMDDGAVLAEGARYRTGPGDDGTGIVAEILRGDRTLRTDPVTITRTPPRLRPVVLDEVFDLMSGPQPLPAAFGFEGDGLRYTLSGTGARIDPQSGLIEIATDRAHAGRDLTVRAENSGGMAEMVIRVAVEDDATPAETTRSAFLEADGVQFRFETPVEMGRFITGAMGTGDPFVVGPVTLLDYSPGPRRTADDRDMNGAMLNPEVSRRTGFDSLVGDRKYREELNAGRTLPLQLEPGDALIVAVSDPEAENGKSSVHHYVVLTVLAEVPPADAFRPPYAGPDRPLWRVADLHLDRLAQLSTRGTTSVPDPDDLLRRFGRFAVELSPNWNRDYLRGEAHPPGYGRDLTGQEADPYVWVNANVPLEDKLDLAIELVQRGIDRYGAFLSGVRGDNTPWGPDGGHNSGRKFSIMFAGQLLDAPEMIHVHDRMREEGGWFQEDAMTFHVTQEHVDETNAPDWRPSNAKRGTQPYTPAMIGMPDWRGKNDEGQANAYWSSHPYRLCCNANTQHGQVLAVLAMGLQEAWGHPAYFDYHMRYMEIMDGRYDPFARRGGDQALYNPVEGSRPAGGFEDWKRRWRHPWAWDMLMQHRFTYYSYPWDS